ncbi:alpha/beta hydrolase [Lactococcus garvieae]|uniref:Alpha/beta hydrolase n=1 Tax=Lactococcus garvieae TaxID=1363 RepID=A0A6L2ZW06_9LACT|nr:alpha/beta hydrolase [Lactococcus garvieae]GFO51677.1 alpha/beta hydrolase [Lactococcus garvieae]
MKKNLLLSLGMLTILSFSIDAKAQVDFGNSAFCERNEVRNISSETTSPGEKTSPIIQGMVANQLYHFGFDRNAELPLVPSEADGPYIEEFRAGNQWIKEVDKKVMTLPFIDNDGAEKILKGYFIENPTQSKKTIIFSHGYRMNALQVGGWVKMYYDMGYNILVPDSRAHGMSDGNDISFGWKEKEDYKNWVDQLVEMQPNMEIVIAGVSMGASTTMMASGEIMPENVKGYIEDSGYTSVYDEFEYLKPTVKELINKYLEDHNINTIIDDNDLNQIIKLIDKKLLSKQGFTLSDASSIHQLQKNTKPVLFIHGSEDTLVPTSAVYKNFEASKGIKELWVVPETGHGLAVIQDRPEYQQRIETFLNNL